MVEIVNHCNWALFSLVCRSARIHSTDCFFFILNKCVFWLWQNIDALLLFFSFSPTTRRILSCLIRVKRCEIQHQTRDFTTLIFQHTPVCCCSLVNEIHSRIKIENSSRVSIHSRINLTLILLSFFASLIGSKGCPIELLSAKNARGKGESLANKCKFICKWPNTLEWNWIKYSRVNLIRNHFEVQLLASGEFLEQFLTPTEKS